MRQAPPSPSAVAWLCDLSGVRGPRLVVLRDQEAQARAAVGEHLIDLPGVDADECEELLAEAILEPVEVIW